MGTMLNKLTQEEIKYIEKAQTHYGHIRCTGIPADNLIRVGKLLSQRLTIKPFQGRQSLTVEQG